MTCLSLPPATKLPTRTLYVNDRVHIGPLALGISNYVMFIREYAYVLIDVKAHKTRLEDSISHL